MGIKVLKPRSNGHRNRSVSDFKEITKDVTESLISKETKQTSLQR